MKIQNYPLVKVLLPYVAGIMVAYFGDFSESACRVLSMLAAGCLAMIVLLTFVKGYRWCWLQTVTMNVAFVLAGISLTDIRFHPAFENKMLEEHVDWVVRVAEEPTMREKSVKTAVEVLHNADNQYVKAKVLLYLKPSLEASQLRYGDLLLVHTDLSRILPPCNPDAFDNQQYMRRRGIYYTGFVREGAWEVIGHRPANPLRSFAQHARKRLTSLYASAGMSGDEFDILKAILLGDDDTLDPELKASYSSAGVSHILCVSGMHVGVIFMIINFLLKPMDCFPTSKAVKMVLVMLVIWLYAHITGLAPSVTRSATMFSFVAVGQLLHRNTNVFHSLFASAFILLIINPLLLFEVGFQLSYLAVSGIVLFQPKLAAIYHCRTKIGNYFWELLTVSVAAQLGTSPISIYYFTQFPNYFMLSNLSVIALSFVVIITGVVLLPISLIPVIPKYLSWLLTMEIRVMNRIIVFIEQLPHSVTENIDYHFLQVLLLYGVIGCFCSLLYHKNRKVFWTACVLGVLFCGSFPIKKLALTKETEFLAYHIRKSSALGFCYHGQLILFSDSIRTGKDKLYQYNIRNHVRKRCQNATIVPIDTGEYDTPFLCKRGNFIRFGDKTYYLLNRSERVLSPPKGMTLHADCLIIRQNPRQPPDEVMVVLPFYEVVADATNTPFYVERWRAFCVENGIPFMFTGNRNLESGT